MQRDELSQLIALVRNSDEEAARDLVECLYPAVIKIARNHLPRRESEEDLCQEIFLKIFAKLHQYRAEMPFQHWVSRIAVNTCIDHLRKQRNRPEYRWSDFSEDQQAMLENLKENSSQPPEQSPEESRELLSKLLLALKPAERLVGEAAVRVAAVEVAAQAERRAHLAAGRRLHAGHRVQAG